MRAELETGRSKYLVALAELGHRLAHRLDLSGELHPQYLDLPWRPKAGHGSHNEWDGSSHPPVRCRNRRRMNADKDLIVLGNRLFDVRDLHDLRRSVSAINGSFHGRSPAPSIFVHCRVVRYLTPLATSPTFSRTDCEERRRCQVVRSDSTTNSHTQPFLAGTASVSTSRSTLILATIRLEWRSRSVSIELKVRPSLR